MTSVFLKQVEQNMLGEINEAGKSETSLAEHSIFGKIQRSFFKLNFHLEISFGEVNKRSSNLLNYLPLLHPKEDTIFLPHLCAGDACSK